jgi:hypothetical protein
MTIVHIGLGKTATTSLQKRVFPELLKRGLIKSYNPSRLTRLLLLNRLTEISADQRKIMQELIEETRGGLVSFESLVDWDPREWQNARDRNLDLFGRKSTILLTIREPRGYLTSIYQQMVAQGHVVSPREFFANPESIALATGANRRAALEFFDQNAFDLKNLVNLYEKAFDKVVVVAMPQLSSMSFLDALCEADLQLKNFLKAEFLIRENKSFSKFAMSLTLRRERVLNFLGLRSQSSQDFSIAKLDKLSKLANQSSPAKNTRTRLRTSPKNRLRRILSWRYLMQVVVNRGFVYKKYELPAGILNESVIKKNLEFYNEVLAAKDGYLVLGRLNGRNRKS